MNPAQGNPDPIDTTHKRQRTFETVVSGSTKSYRFIHRGALRYMHYEGPVNNRVRAYVDHYTPYQTHTREYFVGVPIKSDDQTYEPDNIMQPLHYVVEEVRRIGQRPDCV